jgi:hypothetical protein
MYRVSYTVDAGSSEGSANYGRTRRTEYFATETEALARISRLLNDGRCSAICAAKRLSHPTGSWLASRLAGRGSGPTPNQSTPSSLSSARPLLPVEER